MNAVNVCKVGQAAVAASALHASKLSIYNAASPLSQALVANIKGSSISSSSIVKLHCVLNIHCLYIFCHIFSLPQMMHFNH